MTDSFHRHLLTVSQLSRDDVEFIFQRASHYAAGLSSPECPLRDKTCVNVFFESSTRTQSSFEMAAKRLGAHVVNVSPEISSMRKGETLIDTAITLNAMRADVLVMRHPASGAVALLARKVDGSVINAGDGTHEHPTQALLDAMTVRNRLGDLSKVRIAICGDIRHSRVARSDTILFTLLGAQVHLIAPPTLMPASAADWGAHCHTDMDQGLQGCNVVMMLRLQRERMNGTHIPSIREYVRYYGLDAERLSRAADDAVVMHPGPMNRGMEISNDIADDPDRSLIAQQVQTGVAVRMATLDLLAAGWEKRP